MNSLLRKYIYQSILILVLFSTTLIAQFKLPKYECVELKNGLTIYLMEKKDVPIISIAVSFDAGSVKDGLEYGLASFTAEALKFGTRNYTKYQIDSLFNFYGSNLSVFTYADYSVLFTQLIKDNLGVLLPVLTEVVTNPSFPSDEIEKRKQRWLAEIDQMKESPRAVIGNYFNKLVFDDNVYSNPVYGTKATIGKLQQIRVKEFYSFNYRPETSAIAVVGDFETEKMKKLLESYFGDWTNNSPKVISDLRINLKSLEEPRVYLINKDNSYETTFMIGGLGVPKNNPDRIQIDVINTILGGRFTSWLNDELRVNAGLTYGARSRFNSYKQTGTFFFTSFTATKNTEAALDLAMKTYNRLFEKGIDEATLTSAKNYVKGQFPPDFETSTSLALFLIEKYVFGINDSFINGFEKMVDELDVNKANAIVKKYFPKENLQFVLIGKEDDIRDIAIKYGSVIEKNLNEDGY